MDSELLIALIVLWTSTTMMLVVFLGMWFYNKGEAFHPHSVDVERRHTAFVCVNSKTICKKDFVVKSISMFVAPRGASSSKYFTFITAIVAITGALGSSRWYFVGDATGIQAIIAVFGYVCLFFVAAIELDVEPARFLDDKIMVTGWLIEKLKLEDELLFSINGVSEDFKDFLRSSPEIYYLYEEDRYLHARESLKYFEIFSYNQTWLSFHVLGAIGYVVAVPIAVVMNEKREVLGACVTAFSFIFFSLMGYFTGNYISVLKIFRGFLMVWNPFLREPHFMLKLKRSILAYKKKKSSQRVSLPPPTGLKQSLSTTTVGGGHVDTRTSSSSSSSSSGRGMGGRVRRRSWSRDYIDKPDRNGFLRASESDNMSENEMINRAQRRSSQDDGFDYDIDVDVDEDSNCSALLHATSSKCIDLKESALVDRALDSMFLRYARQYPEEYLRSASYLMVLSEIVALLTPSVLIGLQFVTALCDGPPTMVVPQLIYDYIHCFLSAEQQCVNNVFSHCIVRR